MSIAPYRAEDRVKTWVRSGSGRNQFDDSAENLDTLTTTGTEIVDGSSEILEGDDGILGSNVPLELWDELTNKQLGPEYTNQWLSMLERGEDKRIQSTYFRSKRIGYMTEAPRPHIGLVFCPGADRPTVNRLEESDMVDKKPDQRDSIWRIGTAGPLLSTCTVTKDLAIKTEDHTVQVIDTIHERHWNAHDSNDRRDRMHFPGMSGRDTVTIDSDNIQVVNKLRNEFNSDRIDYDLCATLIEVDASSLLRVVTHFQKLVSRSSHAASHDRNQLENMMEDSRFFCTRSPILFRMKTRSRIIDAVDIRYGIDDEQGFKTIYPSKGIQQLISLSAAYYNSLSSVYNRDATQQSVKPRFLQTLCLLLSMLANSDLETMGGFLNATYGINARRQEMEILFLKVIPLASINPRVFLTSVIESVFSKHLDIEESEEEPACWETILRELAKRGYLLPGTIDDLGRTNYSWLMKWPEDGIKTNHCFGRLQLHGSTARGFNEIQPVVIASGNDDEEKKITIYLSSMKDHPYKIDAADYEHIHCLNPGTYILEDPEEGGSEVKLHILSRELNRNTNQAVKLINALLPQSTVDFQRGGNKFTRAFSRRGRQEPTIIAGDLQTSPAITRHEAWLEGGNHPLAVAWKCQEKTISRVHMLRLMRRPLNRINAIILRYVQTYHGIAVKEDQHYRQVLALLVKRDRRYERVLQLLAETESVMDAQRAEQREPDTPITRSVHPDDSTGQLSTIWYEYQSRFRADCNYLFVNAQRDLVDRVEWTDHEAGHARVTLARIPTKFDVAVLRPELDINRSEEITQGDHVFLMGKYLVVASVAHRCPPISYNNNGTQEQMYEMANWLEILSVDEQARKRRGRNKENAQLPLSVFV